MKNIVGVRFRKTGKVYFFDPGHLQINNKDFVIVETAQGQEYGEVIIDKREIPEEKVTTPLKKVIRIATKKDELQFLDNRKKEKEAFEICINKIKEHKLDMKLIEVEYVFDRSKILFFFSAEGRIDFRELVKDLAAIFRTRIELRQIGIRDEVKKIGGNGVCGRELCCCSFLNSFETVSIKMAKEQNVALNPSKISGNCGRLMCCLKYEQEVYEEKLKKLPKIGAVVETPEGIGEVNGIETLQEKIKVKITDGEDVLYRKFAIGDIKIIKNVETEDKLETEEEKELKKLEELSKKEEEM
ncbi:MAG: stage 0 sporulation family protein [Oscillospiraceae bacterium]|nr:stage 0 sporulation family protein [Oscillospiraceae bacterium]